MDDRHALEEENRRLKRLRFMVDLTLSRLIQDPELTLLEALELVERCRDGALRLFPGKEVAFELIYRPRFERVLASRWSMDLPDELGDRFVLDSMEGD